MKKISFIIQGPTSRTIDSKYKEVFLSFFKNLKNYGEVILSTYKNEPIKEFEDFVDNISLTTPFYRHQIEHVDWKNIYNQYETCLNGCLLATGDYCIKFRTDEYYSNIEHIISRLYQNKFICSNIHYAIPIAAMVYNYDIRCSDHFFGANTELLKEICEECLYTIGENKERMSYISDYMEKLKDDKDEDKIRHTMFVREINSLTSPEGLVLKSLIKVLNIPYEDINYYILPNRYLSIVDIGYCRPYIWAMGKKNYTNLETYKMLLEKFNLPIDQDLRDDSINYAQWITYDFIKHSQNDISSHV